MTTDTGQVQVPATYELRRRDPKELYVAVVYAQWNADITVPLKDGAVQALSLIHIFLEGIVNISYEFISS